MPVVDLFAGPGGWDVAASALGLDPLGVEFDDRACETRTAAGLRTVQADVSALDPETFAPVTGLIASPPCQAFSMAGSGEGRRALAAYERAMHNLEVAGVYDVEALDKECSDPRGHLVLEPLRWAMGLRPEWIACEQVEPVLPLWEAMAGALRRMGYSTWCGVLSAEQYGVPQTRRRAILIASRVREVQRPLATHARYVPPRRSDEQTLGLFEPPEPERIVLPEDRDLLPWVSMAEALGWGHDRVGFPRRADSDPDDPPVVVVNGEEYRDRDFRDADEPSFALTEKARSWVRFRATNDRPNATERAADEPAPALAFGHNPPRWIVDTGNTRGQGEVDPDSDRVRAAGAPSPALTTRADQMEWREPPTHLNTGRDWKPGGSRADAQTVPVTEPAPTISGGRSQAMWVGERPAPTLVTTRRSDEGLIVGRQLPAGEGRNVGGKDWVDGPPAHARERETEPRDPDWPAKRPATTVAGDPRLAQPGHKSEESRPECPGRMEGAVRVTLAEALVLQSFPSDYPVQGNKTKQFEQVGNAICPLLALAILSAVTGGTVPG